MKLSLETIVKLRVKMPPPLRLPKVISEPAISTSVIRGEHPYHQEFERSDILELAQEAVLSEVVDVAEVLVLHEAAITIQQPPAEYTIQAKALIQVQTHRLPSELALVSNFPLKDLGPRECLW